MLRSQIYRHFTRNLLVRYGVFKKISYFLNKLQVRYCVSDMKTLYTITYRVRYGVFITIGNSHNKLRVRCCVLGYCLGLNLAHQRNPGTGPRWNYSPKSQKGPKSLESYHLGFERISPQILFGFKPKGNQNYSHMATSALRKSAFSTRVFMGRDVSEKTANRESKAHL